MFLKVLDRDLSTEYYQIVHNVKEIVTDMDLPSPKAEYYHIHSTPGNVALNRVIFKAGPRAKTREYEIAEIEANGVVVGQAEVLI